MRLFLVLNGVDVRAPEDAAFDLVMAVAAGELTDVAEVAAQLRQWLVPQRRAR
jgi:death on curing protein